MDSKDESEYLQHHGVLGMHWGIRRYQPYPKGHKGDGRYLGEAKRRLAQTGRVVSRTAAKAGRAAVTKAKTARQAYKDAAPEREARREARSAARFERRVSNRKEKAYQHPERLSDKELAARIERLKQEKQFKELSDEVIHPGKKRMEQYQDRIINKVIDKATDEAINRAFKAFDDAVKRPSEADKLKKQADIAKSRADIAKAEADVQNQKNRMERLKDGSYEKGKKEKDYVLDNDSSSKSSSGNQNEGQSSKAQTAAPSTAPTPPKGTGIQGMKWGVRESSSETQSSSKPTTRREFERAERDKIKAENSAAKKEWQSQKAQERADKKQYRESMKYDERSSSSWDNDESYTVEKTSFNDSNNRTSTRVAVPRAVTGLTTKQVSSLPNWTDSMDYAGPIVKSSSSTKVSSLASVSSYTSRGTNYAKTYMKTDSGAAGYRKDARYNKGYRIDTKK